jgi:dihydrofolate reductase
MAVKQTTFSLLVAFDERRAIGFENRIPWFIPGELKWVKEKTVTVVDTSKRNALIMGRNTFDSLGTRAPLAGRLNIVVSSTMGGSGNPDVYVAKDFNAAVQRARKDDIETAFFFGGSRIYQEALFSDVLDEVLTAQVKGQHDADTFFPCIPDSFSLSGQETFLYGAENEFEVLRSVYTRIK